MGNGGHMTPTLRSMILNYASLFLHLTSPVGVRDFVSPKRPDRLWGPHSLVFNDCREYSGRPFAFIYCQVKGWDELYLHFPIRLHVVHSNNFIFVLLYNL